MKKKFPCIALLVFSAGAVFSQSTDFSEEANSLDEEKSVESEFSSDFLCAFSYTLYIARHNKQEINVIRLQNQRIAVKKTIVKMIGYLIVFVSYLN